ncbi:hypothetical protein [Sorangium sp. So ce1151]|uniref:hypothetical protein n=1 Tax=Sorangium sp. So ce1151 TaxID=3133332 RepID=UPI003F619D08
MKVNGHVRDVVAGDREALSSARVRVRCAPAPGHALSPADVCVTAVLGDGTEIPLRGVTGIRFHVDGDAAAVRAGGGVELSIRLVEFETDVEAGAAEERA